MVRGTWYELAFLVDPLSERQESLVLDHFDAVPRIFAGGCELALAAEGPSVLAAVQGVVLDLDRQDIRVHRLVEDLVTRSAIAERAGVAPGTVDEWTREMRERVGFPLPFTASAGGLWLWGPVNRWLGTLAPDLSDGFTHPEISDHVEVNQWLLSRAGML
ncbi:hypothetical protein [Kineosporia sp. NBRC 101731]|uniref:hypothetical protein n=1 Tax=Kineosporia sp. NBRC 101731 TaxID=3032199 RepID=UPI0024A40D6C|nr:hypothetical protein [Kineosporia sp. NBRC 101731]GLY32152.1 transcriptional regulator [Kineosporia sp. NBRC 101731]